MAHSTLADPVSRVREIVYEIAGKQCVGLDIRDSIWAFDDRGDAG